MTVCIATLCDEQKTILLAADRMISSAAFETEFATSKISKVHPNWWAMMAANDIAPVFSIVDKVKNELKGQDEPSLDSVLDILGRAFKEERIQRGQTAVLGPIALTIQDFINEGRSKLGDAIFERLYTQIQWSRLDCQIILAGFDETGIGRIVCVTDPGQVDRFDNPGFCAIGSGSQNALSMLYFRAADYTDPVHLALYQIDEAKIFAGFAPGVGWETEILILRHGHEPKSLTVEEVKRLDSIWNEEGKPRWPKRLKSRLQHLSQTSRKSEGT